MKEIPITLRSIPKTGGRTPPRPTPSTRHCLWTSNHPPYPTTSVHVTFTQWRGNVGLASKTLGQHSPNTGSTSRVFWDRRPDFLGNIHTPIIEYTGHSYCWRCVRPYCTCIRVRPYCTCTRVQWRWSDTKVLHRSLDCKLFTRSSLLVTLVLKWLYLVLYKQILLKEDIVLTGVSVRCDTLWPFQCYNVVLLLKLELQSQGLQTSYISYVYIWLIILSI